MASTTTHFPGIYKTAKALGVHQTTLWRALIGRTGSADLVQRYFDHVAPDFLAMLPLSQLPAGTRLDIPDASEREQLASGLGDCLRADGDTLILTVPLPIARLPENREQHPVYAKRGNPKRGVNYKKPQHKTKRKTTNVISHRP